MARSTSTKTVTSIIVAFALIAVLAAFAAVAAGGSPAPSDRPDPSPTAPAPTPSVTPEPTPEPTAEPTSEPTDPVGEGIVLDVADDHEVVVVIANASDTVTGARSGKAAEGMSVRWGDVVVENVDEDTIRLTWSGWLVDETITVAVAAQGDELLVTLTQKMPYENTDAMGGDRVLELDLAESFDADDVRAEFVAAQ